MSKIANHRIVIIDGVGAAKTLSGLPNVHAEELQELQPGIHRVRITGHVDFAIWACERQGYGTVYPDDPDNLGSAPLQRHPDDEGQ